MFKQHEDRKTHSGELEKYWIDYLHWAKANNEAAREKVGKGIMIYPIKPSEAGFWIWYMSKKL